MIIKLHVKICEKLKTMLEELVKNEMEVRC